MTRFRKIVLVAIAAAMSYLLLLVVFGDNGFVELNRMWAAHDSLLQANELLTQKNLKKYRIIERLQNDPAFMEYTARRELGMVRSDELIFKFKSNKKSSR